MSTAARSGAVPEAHVDAVVVGAGIGGLYAIHRLTSIGLSVLGLESASGVGGVWYYNRYPGARVDVESFDYSYYFSPELYAEWRWSERYAGQPELLRYLNYVAYRFDIRRHILFDTPLDAAQWQPEAATYRLTTGTGRCFSARFLVLATGNLSAARNPDFPGLESFTGEWVQASHWTDRRIPLAGRQIAVIGTGSSGVQITPVVAEQANNLYVFQRTANFSVPARNGPLDNARIDAMAADVPGRRAHLLATRAGNTMGLVPVLPYANFTPEERRARLEQQWALGGQGMNRVFADQGIDAGVNRIVADFVRAKIREIVKDPDVAEQLCPYDHPIGTRRLCMDTGYYETFNRDNVTLVNVARDPIDRITPRGIKTRSAHYEVDLIIFALGFHAFRGAMDRIDIRNQHGVHPTDRWSLGPRTLLGLMTAGFPNLFFLTGPGSPSVLANLVLMNEVHVDFVASLISHMARHGHDTVEPELAAEDGWVERVAAAASKLLRLGVSNYMVQVNPDDGSRVFMPYVAGLDVFSRTCDDIVERGFPGFVFGSAGGRQAASARHREAVR